jgi:hypothetical protein
MRIGFGSYTLMVAIVLYGVLLGGVVYSHIVFFPVYLGHLPDSASLTNGPYALHEENFWLLIHPMLLTSLVVAIFVNWRDTYRRWRIAITLGVYVVVLAVSSLWFIPQLGEFRESPRSTKTAEEWSAQGERWQHMSWVRGSTLFLASIPLLLALTKREEDEG